MITPLSEILRELSSAAAAGVSDEGSFVQSQARQTANGTSESARRRDAMRREFIFM
jgi:hypothetical protein